MSLDLQFYTASTCLSENLVQVRDHRMVAEQCILELTFILSRQQFVRLANSMRLMFQATDMK